MGGVCLGLSVFGERWYLCTDGNTVQREKHWRWPLAETLGWEAEKALLRAGKRGGVSWMPVKVGDLENEEKRECSKYTFPHIFKVNLLSRN